MLSLQKKRAQMGVINNRIEKHGDQDVTAFDIPIEMLLDPEELNDLLGDKYAHRALFDTKGNVATPMLPMLAAMSLTHDLDEATVTLHLAGGTELEYEKVRLKGLRIEPVHGGETGLTFKLQIRPKTPQYAKLINAQVSEIQLTIADAKVAEKGKDKQQQLDLGEEGEGGDESAPRKPPRNGAQPEAH